jgi:hypothetical protein
VHLARQRGAEIAIRSGGHSWVAAFLRDGGMPVDFSEITPGSRDGARRFQTLHRGTLRIRRHARRCIRRRAAQ